MEEIKPETQAVEPIPTEIKVETTPVVEQLESEKEAEQLARKKKETPVEEKKTEPVVEAPKVEPVVEAPKVEPVAEAPKAEQLNEVPKKDELKEQLEAIREARILLAKSFEESREQKSTIEKLTLELDSDKKTIESLNAVVATYKARDEEAAMLERNKRLEKLSADFKILGQEKSIEQLSKLENNVIAELEEVTKLAIHKKDSEKLDIATVPTQVLVEKPVEVKVAPVVNKSVSTQDFMKGLCNVLTKQQSEGTGRKALQL